MKIPFNPVVFGLALSIVAAYGQTYDINWSTIDNGGGAMSGGGLSLNATIGQPDAGESISGGIFTLTGGFWPRVTVIGSEPIPALSVELAAPIGQVNTVILRWPNTSAGFVLQKTMDITAPGGGWSDVTLLPTIVGANKQVTLPATERVCLFRLRKP